MSELVQLEMTLDEARETDRLIKRHINTTRYLLLDMRDRKGWKALGYESFKAYGEKELGYQENYIHKLVNAAEISLQIGFDPDCTMVQPSERQLRPLMQVPEEERKAIWDEATRKAEAEHAKLTAQRVEDAVKEWKQRSSDWHSQYIGERDKLRQAEMNLIAMEKRIDHYTAQPAPEPVMVEKEVIPPDYEALKAKAAQLETELATNKAEQDRIIQNAIKAKLQGYQSEVDALEAKKRNLEQQAKDYQDYLASLTGATRQMEAQSRAFEKTRQALVDLASELADFYPVSHDLNCKAISLAEMHENAAQSLRAVFNDDDGNSPAGIMRWFDQWNRLTGEGNK